MKKLLATLLLASPIIAFATPSTDFSCKTDFCSVKLEDTGNVNRILANTTVNFSANAINSGNKKTPTLIFRGQPMVLIVDSKKGKEELQYIPNQLLAVTDDKIFPMNVYFNESGNDTVSLSKDKALQDSDMNTIQNNTINCQTNKLCLVKLPSNFIQNTPITSDLVGFVYSYFKVDSDNYLIMKKVQFNSANSFQLMFSTKTSVYTTKVNFTDNGYVYNKFVE